MKARTKYGQMNGHTAWSRLALLVYFKTSFPPIPFFPRKAALTATINQTIIFLFFRIEQLKALLEESTTSESDGDDSSVESSSSEEEKKKGNRKSKIKHKKKSKKKHKHKRYKSSKDSERDRDSIKRHSREKRKERWFPFKEITCMWYTLGYQQDTRKFGLSMGLMM